MMMDEMIYLNKKFTESELDELRQILEEAPCGIIAPAEPIVKVLKCKNGEPTVIEYNGRRFIRDHGSQYRK
jgi:hypothetical protein